MSYDWIPGGQGFSFDPPFAPPEQPAYDPEAASAAQWSDDVAEYAAAHPSITDERGALLPRVWDLALEHGGDVEAAGRQLESELAAEAAPPTRQEQQVADLIGSFERGLDRI